MSVLRRQTLFIRSSDRVFGAPYDYTINLQDGLVRCNREDEVLEVGLSQFFARATWLALNNANRSLAFVNLATAARTTVALQAGNYTMRALAKALAAAYPAGIVEAKFLPQFAHLRLRFAAPHRVEFPTLDAAKFFGFGALQPVTDAGNALESTETLNPAPVTSVCVHLEGLHPLAGGNGISRAGGVVVPTNLLMAIPVAAAPFCDIEYRNTSEDFSMVVADRRIHTLRIRITDFAGAPVTFMPDHNIVLTVTVRGGRAPLDPLAAANPYFLRPLLRNPYNDEWASYDFSGASRARSAAASGAWAHGLATPSAPWQAPLPPPSRPSPTPLPE